VLTRHAGRRMARPSGSGFASVQEASDLVASFRIPGVFPGPVKGEVAVVIIFENGGGRGTEASRVRVSVVPPRVAATSISPATGEALLLSESSSAK
jgi:hypothetical protein